MKALIYLGLAGLTFLAALAYLHYLTRKALSEVREAAIKAQAELQRARCALWRLRHPEPASEEDPPGVDEKHPPSGPASLN